MIYDGVMGHSGKIHLLTKDHTNSLCRQLMTQPNMIILAVSDPVFPDVDEDLVCRECQKALKDKKATGYAL